MNINLLGRYNLKFSKLKTTFNLPKNSNTERHRSHTLKFFGEDLFIHDSASFNLGLEEIYRNECYKFYTPQKTPTIIDCGANIGMSIIYFKKLYPSCQIHAFEADPKIFEYLEKNINSFKFTDVKLYNKAIWKNEDTLEFYSEYGAGGRLDSSILESGLVKAKYKVQGFKLSNLLKELENVDFLKIDIEGAEIEVLKEISNNLDKVDNMFIEYHSFIGQKQELDQLLKILSDNNFVYFIKNTLNNKFPFIDVVNIAEMDLQLEIYAKKQNK